MDEVALGVQIAQSQGADAAQYLLLDLREQMGIGLVGTERVEEPADDGRRTRSQVEFAREPFCGQFGDAVNVHRSRGHILRHGTVRYRIYGRGACHEDLFHRWGRSTCIQHAHGAHYIDVRRFDGMLVAVRNEVHRCEMQHDGRLFLLKYGEHTLPIPDIDLVEALVRYTGKVAPSEGQVVDHTYAVTLAGQVGTERRTDETRATRDEHLLPHVAKVGRGVLSTRSPRMRISIVLPCYNAAAHLERCLTGLFAQTHGDLELIAVNDGSTDNTGAVLEAALRNAPFPTTMIHQANAGACAARNAGLHVATGSYIQFMDADDELLPEKIAHQAAIAEQNGLPDLIVGSARTFNADGEPQHTDVQRPGNRDLWMDLMRHHLGGTPTNLWKSATVRSVGGWNIHMKSSQEYDLMFRLLQQHSTILFDDSVLTNIHLQASGSVSTRKLDGTWLRFIELRTRIIDHVRSTLPHVDPQPYHQVLFDSIRTLYPYSPEQAVALYEQHLPKGFSPGLSTATGRGYLLLHRTLGFSLANKVRGLMSARR